MALLSRYSFQMRTAVKNKLSEIIIAEDDDQDFFLLTKAFTDVGVKNKITRCKNGEELVSHLKSMTSHDNVLVILDINMPKVNGFEALEKINAESMMHVPIIVLTSSSAESHMIRSYEYGANSYIVKPVSFADFKRTANKINDYWSDLVEIPAVKPN